jgi:hypothetical protein
VRNIIRRLEESAMAKGDRPYARFTLGTPDWAVQWMRRLPRSVRFELGELVRASVLSLAAIPDGIIEDFLEEHGGDRRIAHRLRYAIAGPDDELQN